MQNTILLFTGSDGDRVQGVCMSVCVYVCMYAFPISALEQRLVCESISSIAGYVLVYCLPLHAKGIRLDRVNAVFTFARVTLLRAYSAVFTTRSTNRVLLLASIKLNEAGQSSRTFSVCKHRGEGSHRSWKRFGRSWPASLTVRVFEFSGNRSTIMT